MKHTSAFVSLLSVLSVTPACLAGHSSTKSTTNNVENFYGSNNSGGKQGATNKQQATNAPQTSASGVPIPVRRDLAHLFGRRSAAAQKGGKGGAGGGGAGGAGGAGGTGGAGGVKPIGSEAIVQMIKGGHAFPPALEKAFQGSPLAKQFQRPANLKAPPSHLADHPAPFAIKALKGGNIPPEVMKAAQAAWGGGGGKGGAMGARGAGGKAGGAGGMSGKTPKAKRDAEAEADPGAEADADADAEWDDDFYDDLVARDPFFLDDDAEVDHADLLIARDAGLIDDDELAELAGMIARREAAAAPQPQPHHTFTADNVGKLTDLIQSNPKAAAAVVKALNQDPKLAQYANELGTEYGGDE